jgi:hypothetical protein
MKYIMSLAYLFNFGLFIACTQQKAEWGTLIFCLIVTFVSGLIQRQFQASAVVSAATHLSTVGINVNLTQPTATPKPEDALFERLSGLNK